MFIIPHMQGATSEKKRESQHAWRIAFNKVTNAVSIS
jgi:hypothetical protein